MKVHGNQKKRFLHEVAIHGKDKQTLNGLKVYISPALAAGEFVLGYNGGDMITSAAVYAPYMLVVPTQLLGFADGAMSQGFSTLYDLKLLNKALLVKGRVVDEDIKVQISA